MVMMMVEKDDDDDDNDDDDDDDDDEEQLHYGCLSEKDCIPSHLRNIFPSEKLFNIIYQKSSPSKVDVYP